MPPEERHELPAPAVPPPPTATFSCRATARGREVEGRRTAFLVTPDALVVSWETGWTGKRRRSIKRRDVRAVTVLPDRTSSLSRHMTQLVIELSDGQTLAPVRRSPAPETTWLADRLREALRPEEPEWSKNGRGPAPVVAAGTVDKVPHAPPRPAGGASGARNARAAGRTRTAGAEAGCGRPPSRRCRPAGGGGGCSCARRVAPFSLHRQLFAIMAMFVLMGLG